MRHLARRAEAAQSRLPVGAAGLMQGLEHYSNPSAALEAVLRAFPDGVPERRRAIPDLVPSRQSYGHGAVLRAVRRALDAADRPLTALEVHAEVERLLGKPVAPDSVRSCLVRSARGSRARIVRISQGRYRLARS